MSIAPIPVIHTIPKISVNSFNGLTLLLTSGAKVVFTTGLMTVLAAANPVCISGSAEYMMDCGTVSALGIRLNMLSSENGNKRRSPTSAQSTKEFEGEIINDPEEVMEHKFFKHTELPDELNAFDSDIILEWAAGKA